MRELLHAARTLARGRGFTAVVVLTLGLGIGATTVVFDLFNVFLWRRPAIERPHEVVEVYTTHSQAFIGPYGALSWPDYLDYRDAATTVRRLVASWQQWTTLETGQGTEEVEVLHVTGHFFEELGLRPALGRALGPDDDRPGAPPVAVLGYRLWKRLGADPDILGATMKLPATAVQIVGVTPAGFYGLFSGSDLDLLIPAELGIATSAELAEARADRTPHAWSALGRLVPGATPEELRAELAVVAARLDAEHPIPSRARAITVEPVRLGHPVDVLRLGSTLSIFAAAVGVLVLIVCANVSNLLLARAISRRREMGIRQSIGASRLRLVRQLLLESLLLALAGAGAGLVLALGVRRLMAGYFGEELVLAMRFDQRVLGLTLAVSGVVTVAFGLAPALIASRVNLVAALKEAAPTRSLGRRLQGRSLLVVLQVALALVLLICCGLLASDLLGARSSDLGFDGTDLLVASISIPEGSTPQEGRALLTQLRERARSIPGVTSAGIASLVPPLFLDVTQQLVRPESPDEVHRSRFNVADAEYFATLGLPLFQGRLFAPRDEGSESGVVVVNQKLADELWPGQSPLGRMVRIPRARPGDPGTDYQVIGVVGNVTQFASARGPEPMIYFTWLQRFRSSTDIVLRTAGGSPGPIFAALREQLRQLDPTLLLANPMTHDEQRWQTLVDKRLQTQTVALFGGAGCFLALLGVFGVISYSVSQRVREIGIRIAVGAAQRDVLRWVLTRGVALAGAGIACGLVASFWAVQLLRGVLPGLAAPSPALLIGSALFLLTAATASVWLPARRASRIDPLRALRQD
ncbi:MAG TPA: ADOP family duplicated permease [Thermoanaerobaculia bacterium]|nr:ADOP family duplicated permease [Thermoanaerobaculia bacterium]